MATSSRALRGVLREAHVVGQFVRREAVEMPAETRIASSAEDSSVHAGMVRARRAAVSMPGLLGFDACPLLSPTQANSPSTTSARFRRTYRASPSKSCSASSVSPTSSSSRRTKIRTARARARSTAMQRRSRTPGSIPTAAVTFSSTNSPRSSAWTPRRSRSATDRTTCSCCSPRHSSARPRGHLLAVRFRGVSDRGAGHGRHGRGHAGDRPRIRRCRSATIWSRWRARSRRAHAYRVHRQP